MSTTLHPHIPAAMVEFPSLAGGEWINAKPATEIACRLAQRIARRDGSRVIRFDVQNSIPVPAYERYDPDPRKAVFIPFYPLPYREKRGGILFPASGYGWYMRDDVLAAIAWLERFVPDFRGRGTNTDR